MYIIKIGDNLYAVSQTLIKIKGLYSKKGIKKQFHLNPEILGYLVDSLLENEKFDDLTTGIYCAHIVF